MLAPSPSHESERVKIAALRPSLLKEESKPAMKLHHVIEAQQFDSPALLHLFDTAQYMEQVVAHGGTMEFQKRIMATSS